MAKITTSKKGLLKIVVTMFAVLALVFVFIIFIMLFNRGAEKKTGNIETGFSSIGSELLLKNFLRIPVHSLGDYVMKDHPPQDLTPDVGETITYADLVAWTCKNDKKSKNYKALKESINTFFDDIYEDDWNLEIHYSNNTFNKKGFGHKGLLKGVEKSLKHLASGIRLAFVPLTSRSVSKSQALMLFLIPYRDKGYGSQIIPCQEGGLALIQFKSTKAFFEVKHLAIMGLL